MLPKAIQDRPWIWIIIGMTVMLGFSVAFTIIAIRNEPKSVPLENSSQWTPAQ
jgi:hypothetical protein